MKSTFGGIKPSRAKNPANPFVAQTDRPAQRKMHFEKLLAEAIANRRLVKLHEAGAEDPAAHTYAPHAVYFSKQRKLMVYCLPADDAAEGTEPRQFEIGRLDSLELTDRPFEPDAGFDKDHARFKNGFLSCV